MTNIMVRYCFLMILVCVVACEGKTDNPQEEKKMTIQSQDIRRSALAGTWYEGNPDKLRTVVKSYMENAKLTPGLGTIIGIISPHAGHVYSGPVAGYAYKHIIGKKYDTVVVVATNHADPRLDFSSVYTRGAYETPLGLVPVDSETAKAIADFDKSDKVRESELGHLTHFSGRMEHSLEIQLPFLQIALGEFKLVPIVMGYRDDGADYCKSLARAIAAAVQGKNALIVASSDLSHFYDVATLKKMDTIVYEHIEAFDPEGLLRDLKSGKCEACGGLPIAAVMMACRELGANTAKVLNMANSGDVTGDYNRPVGYLSAVITLPEADSESSDKKAKAGVSLGLSAEEKDVLRNIVRQTLESVVNGHSIPKFSDYSGKLGEKWGAFVTLKKGGELRGCIGHIIGNKPLIETVAEMARAAALEDSRFPRVKPSELPDIHFEISVLTPIRKINSIDEIVVGRDGIIISKWGTRGLLLPQVATEYGWDLKTFLEHTCLKAGLPRDAWKDKNTTIEIFSAEVFE